jgi:hypothetical protein
VKGEEIYEINEGGKSIIELNELAYADFILSSDMRNTIGKFPFKIIRGCKHKDGILAKCRHGME